MGSDNPRRDIACLWLGMVSRPPVSYIPLVGDGSFLSKGVPCCLRMPRMLLAGYWRWGGRGLRLGAG
jgi:hypothetical protein